MRIKLGFIYFFLFTVSNAFGQEKGINEIDSYLWRIEKLVEEQLLKNPDSFNEQLLIEKKNKSSGTTKTLAYLDLYTYFIYKSTNEAKKYNDEATKLSLELNFKEGYYRAILNQAYIYFIQGHFEKSLSKIIEIELDVASENLTDLIAEGETLKSYNFTEQGKYELALKTALDALEMGERAESDYAQMRAYSAISHVYLRLEEYDKALDNCLSGLDLILTLKKIQYIFPKIDEIARMAHKLEDSSKASKIYEFYLRMEDKIEGPGSYIQSIVYMNIANIFLEQQEFSKAKEFLTKSLTLIDSNNYRFRKPRAHLLMGELYLKLQDTLQSIKSYEEAFTTAKAIAAYDVIKEVSEKLSILYLNTGNSQRSTVFSELHLSVSDSLFSLESEQRIRILETERKIDNISRQKEVLELLTETQSQRYRFLILIFILTLVTTGIAVYSYLKVKKKNRLLYARTKQLTVVKLNSKKVPSNQSKPNPLPLRDEANIESEYIDEDIKEIILTKLKRFEEEKFFLNTKCSLRTLSQKLQTNQKYLSLVINHEKKSNFNNYINELRINHLLDRLVEDEEFRNSKLSYIASSSGFNNLNTFYSAFKKRLGILPSYFIKELNEEEG